MQASDPATKRATTLVFANHKGGCGKTTSTANLGVALAARGRRVLVIDADPQANLSEAFGVTAELAGPRLEDALAPPPAPDVIWDAPAGVNLIPCSAQLEAVASEHSDDPSFATRLRELVDALSPSYDAIVIDTPPGLGPLSSMAMLSADWVVIPARPADFDVGGALQLASLVDDELVQHNPRLRVLGVLVTQVDRRWTLAGDTRRRLDDAGIHRLRVEIPFRVRVGAAPRDGAPTAATQPDGAVGAAYHRLAADLIATVLR